MPPLPDDLHDVIAHAACAAAFAAECLRDASADTIARLSCRIGRCRTRSSSGKPSGSMSTVRHVLLSEASSLPAVPRRLTNAASSYCGNRASISSVRCTAGRAIIRW
jgi:hypothetical protein